MAKRLNSLAKWRIKKFPVNDPLQWKNVSCEHACEIYRGGFSFCDYGPSCLQVQVLLNQQGVQFTVIAARLLVDRDNASSQPRHIYHRNEYKKQNFDLNFPLAGDREKYMQEKIPFEKLWLKLSPKRTHLSVPNAVLALNSKPFSLTALVNLIKLTNTWLPLPLLKILKREDDWKSWGFVSVPLTEQS